ncbi:MAG: xanthine phosphoribosyltransferase [Firmicutes bacterium]|nr:xanthine phosphoribosyltransferase [Bacillota bacterium]
MDKLKKRIMEEGVALGSDRINVDGFINHRIDTSFMDEIGEEFARRFAGVRVDKILTVEASGIAIAVSAARYFGFCPVVFAKKAKPNTMTEGVYQAPCMSFTKQTMNEITVAKKHLSEGENILIIDDFLAHGEASKALASIVEMAGAKVAGIGIVISKDFQGGKKSLEDMGYRVETLASVAEMDNGKIRFAD